MCPEVLAADDRYHWVFQLYYFSIESKSKNSCFQAFF